MHTEAQRMKVILLGDSGVGKTTLVGQMKKKPYEYPAEPTTSPVFANITVQNNQSKQITLEVWDTAGQEEYRALAPIYVRNAQVALICYTKDSYSTVSEWVDLILNESTDTEIAFVLMKMDLLSAPEFTEMTQRIQILLDKYDCSHSFYTSGVTGEGVDGLLLEIASIDNYQSDISAPLINTHNDASINNSSCC